MKKTALILVLATLLLFTAGALAASPDEGAEPLYGDRFYTGGSVTVSRPIFGDVYITAGAITINAPIAGDLIAMGGRIDINAPVSGKVLAAGGDIVVNASVGKLIATGRDVTLSATSEVEVDARIFAQDVKAQGIVFGDLKVVAESFSNTGYAETVSFNDDIDMDLGGFSTALLRLMRIVRLLFVVGTFLVGVLVMVLFRRQVVFTAGELSANALVALAVGVAIAIGTLILCTLLAITVIGLPLAGVAALALGLVTVFGAVAVAYAVGERILRCLSREASPVWYYAVGFVVLRLIFWIPFLGGLIHLLALSAGIGAVAMAVKKNWGAVA